MATFAGKLWLGDDQASQLPGEVTVEPDRISITSGGMNVGSWSRSEVKTRSEGGIFYFTAEGETLSFLPETPGLVGALAGLPEKSSPSPSAASAPVTEPRGTSAALQAANTVLPTRYRSLRLYSRILTIGGWLIIFVGGLMTAILGFAVLDNLEAGLGGAFGVFLPLLAALYVGFIGLGLLAVGQLILVFIDIEANTRMTSTGTTYLSHRAANVIGGGS